VEMIARDPNVRRGVEGNGWHSQGSGRRWRTGKSGGVRVVYYVHSDVMPVFLLTLFAKNEKDNLFEVGAEQPCRTGW